MVSEGVKVVLAPHQASPEKHGSPKALVETPCASVVMPAVSFRPAPRSNQQYQEYSNDDGSIRRHFDNDIRGRTGEELAGLREASVVYRPDGAGAEVVVQISKTRDPHAFPQAKYELLQFELRVQGVTGDPYQQGSPKEVFESATQLTQLTLRELNNPRSKLKPDIHYARLIATLRGMADGRVTVREISAANIGLTFEASEGTPLLLVGLRLKNCSNVSIKGERTSKQQADGLFSVRAPYMIIDGGCGGIEIHGVDCSKISLMNLPKRQDSKLQFRECQLRGAHTVGECGVGTFSCWDCSFGEVVSLGGLKVSQPAQNEQDFSIYFGGSVSTQDCAISLPTALAIEEVRAVLTASPDSFAARMLKSPSEMSLADLVHNSAILAPSLLRFDENERVYQVSRSQDESLEVVCRRYPELPGWRIATLSALSNPEGVSSVVWSRGDKPSAADLRQLEKHLDDLMRYRLELSA